ncbi:hypothetical protein GCM10011579_007970 [Streptomyces albiflavescens]|uniref:Uncharacterized protein n=1 Tax=Streptomyces albiflavescens TaxID=1623582 RepID=A0A917XSX2_9ACTN|nr:hypothetical protein GCM10011579_007970 [Streptomyces albiflavescens]
MSHVADLLVVGAVVHEDPERLADLVGREADALRGVHRREHVLDELPELGAEPGDFFTRCVQDGVAEQGEGPDAPVGARDGAVSHGGKGTVLDGACMSRRHRGGAAIRAREWISIG